MKNLLNKLFKSEPQFNYILAEYQPATTNLPEKKVKMTEYDIDAPETHDEMEIDSLYQNN